MHEPPVLVILVGTWAVGLAVLTIILLVSEL